MSRLNILLPLVLLTVLALLSFWINTSVQEPSMKIDGSSRHDPDYKVENFVTRKTDINGQLRYILASAAMTHYPDDDSTLLTRPRFTQYAVAKEPATEKKFYTQIEGLTGHITESGKEIIVKGNVKVYRPAYNGKGDMTLTTAELTLMPDDEMAKTDSHVVIMQSPGTRITGVGMVFNKKNQTFKLLKNVKVHYENPMVASNNTAKAKVAQTKQRKQNNSTSKLKLSSTQSGTVKNTNKTLTKRQAS